MSPGIDSEKREADLNMLLMVFVLVLFCSGIMFFYLMNVLCLWKFNQICLYCVCVLLGQVMLDFTGFGPLPFILGSQVG